MKRLNRLLIFLSAVLLFGGAIVLWRTGFFQAMSSLAAMRDYIDRLAPYSHLAYFLIQLLSVILAPIPSNITASSWIRK